jgi:DNA-binding CsgD family transcriptional regulator
MQVTIAGKYSVSKTGSCEPNFIGIKNASYLVGSPGTVIRVGNITMSTLGEVFAQGSDAVFGIDMSGRIRFINSQFERLLGYPRDQLCGTRCAEVLCGTDMHGQPFCGPHCPIPKTVGCDTAVSDFDLVVKRADGDSVLVNIGSCYTQQQLQPVAERVSVFFSLRRVNPRRLLQRLAVAPAKALAGKGNRMRVSLTSRETEVLGLATRGMKTTQIAGGLCVSTQTVRTHFKNIYQKIGVHSRTEAVVYALQQGLI